MAKTLKLIVLGALLGLGAVAIAPHDAHAWGFKKSSSGGGSSGGGSSGGGAEHTKNARKSTSDKHTATRSGRSTTKNRQQSGWKSNKNKR